jgi:hypothetical protein
MDKDKITKEQARHEVELASKRLGMLHIAYAKTLVEELGEEKGKELVLKSIQKYGQYIGEQVKSIVSKEGLDLTAENYKIEKARTLPNIGLNEKVVEDEEGRKVYGCTMAKVWRDLNEEELGQLYCYIDTAKYMYYNPNYKLTHIKAMPSHKTDYCQFKLENTTEEERKDFFDKKDWRYLDKNLLEGK